ncbi:hypothetical protein BDZ94DRAFT_1321613 [Collybia nuda]|uniref:Uncharacterized protein n=1 Tax=Collybia nuda TaxID=64659 RepID=A0A9P5Y8G6_9AGAR|nr:hypothetical protein BDZ94DRAFT_1321613 [Collybia nuda]
MLVKLKKAVGIAVPHRIMKDDIYNRYHMPKDTPRRNFPTTKVNQPNSARCHYDRKYVGHSSRRKGVLGAAQVQARALLNVPGTPTPHDLATIGAFGNGRRICPGHHFTQDSLACDGVHLGESEPFDADVDFTDGLSVRVWWSCTRDQPPKAV